MWIRFIWPIPGVRSSEHSNETSGSRKLTELLDQMKTSCFLQGCSCTRSWIIAACRHAVLLQRYKRFTCFLTGKHYICRMANTDMFNAEDDRKLWTQASYLAYKYFASSQQQSFKARRWQRCLSASSTNLILILFNMGSLDEIFRSSSMFVELRQQKADITWKHAWFLPERWR